MTLVQELLKQSKNGRRELARQDLIVSVTEQVWAALEDSNLSKADLARLLETSKSNVTQLLSGNRNMTLATLADIGEAIGVKPCVVFRKTQIALHTQVATNGGDVLPQIYKVKTYGTVMEARGGSASQGLTGSSTPRTGKVSTFLAEA